MSTGPEADTTSLETAVLRPGARTPADDPANRSQTLKTTHASGSHDATRAPSLAGAATVGSPLEAMERDEIMRTRLFCFIATAVAVAGGVSAVLLPGDPDATLFLLVAVGLALCAIVFLVRRTRDPVLFRKPTTVLGWFVPAACVTMAIPYFGVFSPAAVVLVLGIYFVGLGRNTKLAFAVYFTCAGMQALIATLVIAGVLRDTGIVQVLALTVREQIIVQALVQFVFLATFITARVSRHTALVAVGELERAVRLAAHREALLLEAREELERALRSGRGRFTGQILSGFELGAVIGRGAMGEVYEATDSRSGTRSGTPVAIKLLSQASLSNQNHVLRFLRELRTAAGIDSPHVVKVLEVGEQPVPYLVMERLGGVTLGELLKGKRQLTAREVRELIAQIGTGISAAASAGIVHRDLKPQNLFLHHSVWKILDFGVARAIDHGDTLTSGHVVGTPSYMAPEQAQGGTVDHTTDLYALAAIAYRCLTGHPPYAAGDIAETLYRVVHTRPRKPTDLAPRLHPDVDLVLAIGLAKRPQDRFHAAADFATSLARALDGELSAALRDRADALLREGGGWATATPRASTKPFRIPRPPR
ncbi:MAG TPA: serine/threonine-protein kinase [Kofleriaceae bacterium]|nr:serine/threonine-protein kinase [Kofleriaceae bacterium]